MSLPVTTIFKEESKKDKYKTDFFERFIKQNEHWHNGQTFKFQSEELEDENTKYFQFKTIIEEEGHDYFIYDEVIEIDNIPALLLELHNNKTKEVLQQMIYFDKGEVVQQIRKLSYDQFLNEIENDKPTIRLEESENTTNIKTSLLQFIENINREENDMKPIEKIKKVWWRRIPWKIIGLSVFVVAWCAIPVLGNLVVPSVLTFIGVAATSPLMTWLPFAVSGLLVGGIVAVFGKYKAKMKKWFFPKWKSKNDINLEKQLQEQRAELNKKHQKELSLCLDVEGKRKWVFNSFLEKNKNKNFPTIEHELIGKFKKNKNDLNQQNLTNVYQRKSDLQTKIAIMKEQLTWEQTREIEKNLDMMDFVANIINVENQNLKCNSHDLKIYGKEIDNFEQNIKEILKNFEKSATLEKETDIRQKSPVMV